MEWDGWDTGHPEHFGLGADALVMRRAMRINANEGRRIRVTVEILDDAIDDARAAKGGGHDQL